MRIESKSQTVNRNGIDISGKLKYIGRDGGSENRRPQDIYLIEGTDCELHLNEGDLKDIFSHCRIRTEHRIEMGDIPAGQM